MKSFLMGLGFGIGLGILFAPMSGEETRSRLGDTANDLANSARESVEQGRDRVQRGVSAIRSAGERITNEVRPTGTEGPNV
jgi:gas vesicle protein